MKLHLKSYEAGFIHALARVINLSTPDADEKVIRAMLEHSGVDLESFNPLIDDYDLEDVLRFVSERELRC